MKTLIFFAALAIVAAIALPVENIGEIGSFEIAPALQQDPLDPLQTIVDSEVIRDKRGYRSKQVKTIDAFQDETF